MSALLVFCRAGSEAVYTYSLLTGTVHLLDFSEETSKGLAV